jgi:hypothetical protein
MKWYSSFTVGFSQRHFNIAKKDFSPHLWAKAQLGQTLLPLAKANGK